VRAIATDIVSAVTDGEPDSLDVSCSDKTFSVVTDKGETSEQTITGHLSPGNSVSTNSSYTNAQDYCVAVTSSEDGVSPWHVDGSTGQLEKGDCTASG
jgi:hypothetical protein